MIIYHFFSFIPRLSISKSYPNQQKSRPRHRADQVAGAALRRAAKTYRIWTRWLSAGPVAGRTSTW